MSISSLEDKVSVDETMESSVWHFSMQRIEVLSMYAVEPTNVGPAASMHGQRDFPLICRLQVLDHPVTTRIPLP